jgi:hypothetical protein
MGIKKLQKENEKIRSEIDKLIGINHHYIVQYGNK